MHKHTWELAGKKSKESEGCTEAAAIWTCACEAARLVEVRCWTTQGREEEPQSPMSGAESHENAVSGDLKGVMDDLTAEGVQQFLNTARKT